MSSKKFNVKPVPEVIDLTHDEEDEHDKPVPEVIDLTHDKEDEDVEPEVLEPQPNQQQANLFDLSPLLSLVW